MNNQISLFDEPNMVAKPFQYWVHLETATPLSEILSIPIATLKELYPEVLRYGPHSDMVVRFVKLLKGTITLPSHEATSTGLIEALNNLLTFGSSTSWEYCARLIRDEPERVKVLEKRLNNLPLEIVGLGFEGLTDENGAGRILVNLTCPDIFPDSSVQEQAVALLVKAEAKLKVAQVKHRKAMAEVIKAANKNTASKPKNDYSQLVAKL